MYIILLFVEQLTVQPHLLYCMENQNGLQYAIIDPYPFRKAGRIDGDGHRIRGQRQQARGRDSEERGGAVKREAHLHTASRGGKQPSSYTMAKI